MSTLGTWLALLGIAVSVLVIFKCIGDLIELFIEWISDRI